MSGIAGSVRVSGRPLALAVAAGARLRDLAIMLFALSAVLFLLLHVAGDPAVVIGGQDATPEQLEQIQRDMGLDQPLWRQFAVYLGRVAVLDFGSSLASGQDALDLVLAHLPTTLTLALISTMAVVVISLPLGAWLGQRGRQGLGRAANTIVYILQGVPGFVVALLLIKIFAVDVALFPSVGYGGPSSLVLPVATLVAVLAPKLVRVVATSTAEALQADYIRTARASGVSESDLLWHHALPNAALATAAVASAQFAALVGGAVLVETIFARPGIGWLLLKSSETLDFPVIQTIALVSATLVFSVNAATDALFGVLDPRLKLRS